MAIKLIQEVLPSGQSPNVSAPLSLGSGLAAASAEFGNVIGQLGEQGQNLSLRMQSLQAVEEITDGDLSLSSGYNSFRSDLQQGRLNEDGSRDPVDTDYAGHVEKFDAWHKETSEAILGGFKNNRARESASTSFREQGVRWRREIELGAFDSLRRQSQAKISPKIDAYNERILQTAGANERQDVLDEREAYLLNLEATGMIDGAGFAKWNEEAGKRLEKLVEERTADAVLAAANQVKGDDGAIDFAGGRDLINATDLPEDKKVEMIRDLKAQAAWDNEQKVIAQKNIEAESEATLWNTWIDPDQPLTESQVQDRFNAGTINSTVRDKYIKRIRDKHPIITGRGLRWKINEMILDVQTGQRNSQDVKSFIEKNFNKIGDSDLNGFQDDLNAAVRKLSEGNLDLTAASTESWGGKQIKAAFANDEFGPASDPKKNLEPSIIHDRRQQQWKDFWKANPGASAEEAQAFLGLLTKPSNERKFWKRLGVTIASPLTGGVLTTIDLVDQFTGKKKSEALLSIEEQITAQLGALQVRGTLGRFILDAADAPDASADPFEVGEKRMINGVEYTFHENGMWKYNVAGGDPNAIAR